MSFKAAFLDRDGTVIPETGGRVADPHVQPLPEAIRAIKKLRRAGYKIVLITNQAAIARGCFTEQELAVAHEALFGRLEKAGAALDGAFYCPHLPEGAVPEYSIICECRKPKPGLILKAAKQLDLDISQSYMIGDAERDVLAAREAGCKGAVLIAPAPKTDSKADFVAKDIDIAADWIIERESANG